MLMCAHVTCNLTPAPAKIKITPIDGLFRGHSQVDINFLRISIQKEYFNLDFLIFKH